MNLKSMFNKAGALVLSASMVLSTDLAQSATSVYAQDKMTVSEKVLQVYDMKDATIDGNLKVVLSNDDGAKPVDTIGDMFDSLCYLVRRIKGLAYNPVSSAPSADGKSAILYIESSDEYFGSSLVSEDELKSFKKSTEEFKKYFSYLESIGVGKVDKDGNLILPSKLEVDLEVTGKIKDSDNFNLTVNASIAGSKSKELISLDYADGALDVDVYDLVRFAAYITDSKPNKVVSSISGGSIPISVSGFSVEVFETIYKLVARQYEEYMDEYYYYSNQGDDETASEYYDRAEPFGIALSAFDLIIGEDKDFTKIGKFLTTESPKLIEAIGLVIDGTYDKYTKSVNGKDTFTFTEKDLFDIAVNALTDADANAEKIADKVVSIASDLDVSMDDEAKKGMAAYIANTIKGFVSSYKPYLAGETEKKPELPPFKLNAGISTSLEGEKGHRDFEADGNIVVTPDEKDLASLGEYTMDKVEVSFDLSIKEPEKAVTPSETKLDGPVKGKKVSDKKYIYKVTKQGGTDGTVGALTVTGLKKKSLTTCKIAETVTIDKVKYNVTAVAAKAFKGNKKFKKVFIGKKVKTIGANAFANNTKLKSVAINSKVLKTIGKNAFSGDKKLNKVIIKSKKLKKIGKKAFYRKGGKKLTIVVPKAKKKTYTKFIKKAKTNNYKVK